MNYATAAAANWIGSMIDGSSFSGLFTRVEIGHIRMGLAGNGRINSRGSAFWSGGELLGQGFPIAGPMRPVNIRPEFWEATSYGACKANMVTDHEGPRITSVLIIPIPKPGDAAHHGARRFEYESAVVTYREHYKAHGKDPDDPKTKAPTEKADVALTKRLSGLTVPEKILRDIRKEVWGSRIIPGVVYRPICEDNAWVQVELVWCPEAEDPVIGRFVAFLRDEALSRRLF